LNNLVGNSATLIFGKNTHACRNDQGEVDCCLREGHLPRRTFEGIELAEVNASDANIHEDRNNSNSNQLHLSRLDFLQLIGCALIGIPASGWGWWILIRRRSDWGLHRRLAVWSLLNLIAAVLYWHGAALLLGL
jgi:hypothetical protein